MEMTKTPIQKIKTAYYIMSESQFHHWLATNLKELEQDEMKVVHECIKCGSELVQNEKGRWVNKHDPDTFYENNYK
jgi:transcription initiation factor IIE alpha subunit